MKNIIDSRTVDQDIQIFLQNVNIYPTKHPRCKFSRSLAFGIEGLSNFLHNPLSSPPHRGEVLLRHKVLGGAGRGWAESEEQVEGGN